MQINLEILSIARVEDSEKCSTLNEKTIVTDMMLRRRLTRNSRIAIYLCDTLNAWELPVIIGNAYGEVAETYDILNSIISKQTVSPTAFQNSVHNTPASYLSIVGNNKGYVTTVSDLYETSDAVLKVGAVKSIGYEKMLLIVTDAMDFERFDALNRCGIAIKECGLGLVVRRSSKAATIPLCGASYHGYSPSIWPMLEIHERFLSMGDQPKIISIDF